MSKKTLLNESALQFSVFNLAQAGKFDLVVPNYTPTGWFECDVYGVTAAMHAVEFEIKVSRSDFLQDKEKTRGFWDQHKTKHDILSENSEKGPRRFYFVVPEGLLKPEDEIPSFAGLIEVRNLQHAPRVVRKAVVRTKARPVTSAAIAKIQRNFYWRYWNLKGKHLKSAGHDLEGLFADWSGDEEWKKFANEDDESN